MVLTALEASFVPFVSTGNSFFCGVHRLAALGALWVLSWLERHFGGFGFRFAGFTLELALNHTLISSKFDFSAGRIRKKALVKT